MLLNIQVAKLIYAKEEHNMRLRLTIISLLTLCATLSAQEIDYTKWVDPFIGTADYSATHPGAVVPHGMMAVVPIATIRIRAGGAPPMMCATAIAWALLTVR